jgi:glycerol-3-phosphate O-acyltransferase
MKLLQRFFDSPLNFFWWLRHPLLWFAGPKSTPDHLKEYLNLDPNAPVLYVLPNRSISDLLVLYHFCKKFHLPLPHFQIKSLRAAGSASYLYLNKLGLLSKIKIGTPPPPLQKLCERLTEEKQLNIQIVPVSIIWGRNPGKEERSLFKLLFADDEHAGVIQKLFIILAQGRDSLVNFGKPISLREQVDQGGDATQTARKIRRVMRVHFRTQRNTTLGAKHYDRARIVTELVKAKPLQDAIEVEMRRTGHSKQRVEARARFYLREISSSPTHSMVRFFDVLLTYIWNKIYDGVVVRHGDRVRALAEKYELIYVSSHRSHLDYLILPYELYYMGLRTPHTAAGVNLNFWPIGPILRRGGAFFIRRSFKGNRLYTLAFTEYLRFLVTRGHPIAFFPEGGRSRTGKLLTPKTGMLAMLIHNYLKDSSKPVAFIPLYTGYDSVVEVKSYLKELRGAAKKKESFGQLFKARQMLKAKHGKAYVGFGEAIILEDKLNTEHPNWRSEVNGDEKPKWFNDFIDKIAEECMTNINRTALVSPVGLVGTALLSTPQRAIAENELIGLLNTLREILSKSGYSPEVTLPTGSAETLLAQCQKVSPVNRFGYPGGDVIYLNELDSIILSYYRNNTLHLFALPSLVASYFQHNDDIEIKALIEGCAEIYPFLRADFFLKWNADDLRDEIMRLVQAFVDSKLLNYSEDKTKLLRPNAATNEFSLLRMFGKILGLVFERYSISTTLLSDFIGKEPIKRPEFETQCQRLAQRISILNGVNDPEFYDKVLFHNYVTLLKDMGFVSFGPEETLVIDPRIKTLAERSTALLSPDIRQSIQRLTNS